MLAAVIIIILVVLAIRYFKKRRAQTAEAEKTALPEEEIKSEPRINLIAIWKKFFKQIFTGDLACPSYGPQGAAADFNNDGLLDIYVVSIAELSWTQSIYEAVLYINKGNFVFEIELDHGAETAPFGCALGVSIY